MYISIDFRGKYPKSGDRFGEVVMKLMVMEWGWLRRRWEEDRRDVLLFRVLKSLKTNLFFFFFFEGFIDFIKLLLSPNTR